jgi:hypothetical protein
MPQRRLVAKTRSRPFSCWLLFLCLATDTVFADASWAQQEAPAKSNTLPAGQSWELAAERLEIDLESGEAEAEEVRVTACGSCPPTWSLTARRAQFRRNGDVDLLLPVLRVGPVPLLAWPWLRLRSGRRWGLLMPRVAWRGAMGLEVGQAVWGPLRKEGTGDLTLYAGYLQRLQGGTAEAHLRTDGGNLELASQVGAETWNVQLRGRALAQGLPPELTLAGELQWTANPALQRSLDAALSDEARRYEVSSAALVYQRHPWQSWLRADVLHDLHRHDLDQGYEPRLEAALRWSPGPWGPVQASVTTRTSWHWLADGRQLSPSWAAVVAPEVAAAKTLGPVTTRVTVTSLHAQWQAGGDLSNPELSEPGQRHLVGVGLDGALPLAKRIGRARLFHLLEPSVHYRVIITDSLEPLAPRRHDRIETWPVAGHLLWFELRNRLVGDGHSWALAVRQSVSLPHWEGEADEAGEADEGLEPRLEARLSVTTGLAMVEGVALMDEQNRRLDQAWTTFQLGRPSGTGLSVDWSWLHADQAGRRLEGLGALPLLLPRGPWESGQTLSLKGWFTPHREVQLMAEAMVDPAEGQLLLVGGVLRYRHRCGCLGVTAGAWYRRDRSWPEVMVTADLGGLTSDLPRGWRENARTPAQNP